jgi:hypothetical protein
MWGGRRTIESMHAKQAIFAYTGFLQQFQTDPKGHTIIIFTYDEGPFQLMQYLVYTYPVADLPSFDDLRNVPAVQSSLGLTDYTDLATNILHLGQGNGDCASVATLTLKPDAELFNFAFKTFVEEASSISEYIKGTMELHALPRSQKLTDNLFGLEDGQGPLVSFLLIFSTELERYDAQVIATQQRIIEKVKQEVEERDLYHPFIFANHAGEWQNVIGSFGDRNVRLLSEMASVYDPEQVFQHLQSGSFRAKAAGERLTA